MMSNHMILENLPRIHRQTENSKPEATLIPVDRRGERANYGRRETPIVILSQLKTRELFMNIL